MSDRTCDDGVDMGDRSSDDGVMRRSHALQLCLISDRTFSDGVMSIRFG
ncbi:MAG: hypothetical protein RMX35_15675 [Nostoc sp. DcaGUA01]|nr:hypothetical protein [Nostoc sp. DcaGUA01]